MKRLVSGLLSLGVALSFVQADCEAVTPPEQSCATKTQSVTYEASGGCGARGVITLEVPTAGQCGITVIENQHVQLPVTGKFTPEADQTNYDLTKGNWELAPVPTGSLGDESGLDCTISHLSATEIDLTCAQTLCMIVGDDDEPTCASMGNCMAHLTPAPAGAMPDLDAGLGTDAEEAGEGDASSPHDGGAD